MKCPACGYVSLEKRESCRRCGAAARGRGAVAEILEVGEKELVEWSPQPHPEPAQSLSVGPWGDLRIDDEQLGRPETGAAPKPRHRGADFDDWDWGPAEAPAPAPAPAVQHRDFSLSLEEALPEHAAAEPIIDHDDQVPEHYWVPQAAGLARRALALAADLALLAVILGLFFAGASLALALREFELQVVLSLEGLRAALVPFGLLGLLLSLGYFVFFHAGAGRTPGKRLAGLEVRCRDGSVPSPGVAATRWLFAVLGTACAGAGLIWGLFEPRRRGWADLCSRTVVAERRREGAALTSPEAAGTMRPLKTGRDSSAGRATD